MRPPKDFLAPLAVGAPAPVREVDPELAEPYAVRSPSAHGEGS